MIHHDAGPQRLALIAASLCAASQARAGACAAACIAHVESRAVACWPSAVPCTAATGPRS